MCGTIIGLSSISAFIVLAAVGPTGNSWIPMIVLVYASAFAIDATLSWAGLRAKFRDSALLSLTVAFAGVAAAWAATDGSSDPSGSALAAFFGVGLLCAVEASVLSARGVVRVFSGLRTSGDLTSGVVCAVPADRDLKEFGPDFLEERVADHLASTLDETESQEYIPKTKTDLEFSIARIGGTRILYRVEDGIAQALYVPEDGIVARFETSRDSAKILQFKLERELGFSRADDNQKRKTVQALKVAYAKFAAPTLSLNELWRIRGRAILASTLAILVVAAATVLAFNLSSFLNWLADPKAATQLASIFYLVTILALTSAAVRWLYLRSSRPRRIE